MLNQSKKNILVIMKISYLLMIIGLFLWDWGTIIFLSIFTLGTPLILLILPIFGSTMVRAKSKMSLFVRLFCSLLSLIPLIITITSIPLKTMTNESGDYIVTPHGQVIAMLIIVSGIIFLFATIYLFRNQYQILKERVDH